MAELAFIVMLLSGYLPRCVKSCRKCK